MPNIHKCGACGSILKGFNDDCVVCLAKENPQKADPELEQMFEEEREHRQRAEALQAKIAKYKEKNGN
jgi:hypothetical protein